MEGFSFSLNEAKPKCFGLEMFDVLLLVSWNLPCLLPHSFLEASSPWGLHPVKPPRNLESKSWNASGNLDLPKSFVIFLLKSFIFLHGKKSQAPMFSGKVLDESCVPMESQQRFSFNW